MRATKIIATLGPATASPERLEDLLRAGVNTVRLNFSHGSHDDHARLVQLVRETAYRLERHGAGAARAEEPRHALVHLEGHAVQGHSAAIVLRQGLRFKQGRHREMVHHAERRQLGVFRPPHSRRTVDPHPARS